MKAFLESPDAPPSMPSQRPAALQEHVKALEQQDVILAINRSHEHFDHKGASKLGRHIRQRAGQMSRLLLSVTKRRQTYAGAASPGVEAKKGSSGKHQSALLNLGAVHTHFGHVQVS